MNSPGYPQRLLAEMVGTFGFLFISFGGLAAAAEREGSVSSIGVALGFGIGVASMIFTFGHISGAHFNPAVSFGLACGKRFPWREVPGYWIAQFIGGVLAAGIATAIFDTADGVYLNTPSEGSGQSLVVEVIATMFLVLLIVAVTADPKAPWSGVMAPVAIGGFIVVITVVFGPFSSGSFNPARSLAPAAVAGSAGDLWIFIVGPLVGGLVGGVAAFAMRRSPS